MPRLATHHWPLTTGFRPLTTALVLAAVVLFASCAVGPNYHRPSAPVPDAFKEPPPAGWKQAQPSEGVLRGKWWEIYNDPQLYALEEQVSISNQNVLVALAQYRQARDSVRIARANYFPTLSVSPSASYARNSSTIRNTPGFVSSAFADYSLPADFSYQADLWGSIRRSVTASYANAQVSAADLETPA